jgi:hypothetical protein
MGKPLQGGSWVSKDGKAEAYEYGYSARFKCFYSAPNIACAAEPKPTP